MSTGKTIAVAGKGGSGKTMLTAIMTGLLARRKNSKVLAIDADSAVNLPYALGVEARRTVAGLRRRIIEDPKARSGMEDTNIRTVVEEALSRGEGFQLLVMGRPEGPGCYCSVNDLLRYGIERLCGQFDRILIDCEAGPEQVSRRVVGNVDLLILVTEPTLRGVRVTDSIWEVVRRDESIRPARTGLVVNRSEGAGELIAQNAERWGLEVLGRVPEDQNVARCDREGRPLVDLEVTSPAVSAITKIVDRAGI